MIRYFIGLTLVSLVYLFICVSCVQFGYKNQYTCHCATGSTCDTTTGFCSCQAGWYGPSCQKQNIALNKPANQSVGSGNSPAGLAVNGMYADSFAGCSDTGFNDNPYWLVNLQQTYPIKDVKIYYRSGRVANFEGFSMLVITEYGTETLCYKDTAAVNISRTNIVHCNVSVSGQYIKFIKPKTQNFLSLCEVEVYVCSMGTYGSNCDQFCHCSNSTRCSQDNGACPNNKCQDGWMGSSCNEACPVGTYGPNCTLLCHCADSTRCNRENGTCPNNKCQIGWIGSICNQECPVGSYGQDCALFCHCADSTSCNPDNGTCPNNKCQIGWTGSICNQVQFGYNYLYTCHCATGSTCDLTTGICSSGSCQSGWYGPSCQKQNVALNKPANQSVGDDSSPAGRAVNGNHADTFTGCSDTGFNNNPYWLVNLQQTYPIKDVTIYYRTGKFDNFEGFSMLVIAEDQTVNLCYMDIPPISRITNVQCNVSVSGQYIQFINPKTRNFLSLCEVEVYVCSVGTYGPDCTMFCHCANSTRCGQYSGTCPDDACQDGWTGSSCNTECINGTFGVGCNETCHCFNNNVCHHVTGHCPGGLCAPGWLGDNCQQACEANSYGQNCSLNCSTRYCKDSQNCDHITGTCDGGCLPGYRGDDCTLNCTNNFYGANCSSECDSRHCANGSLECDHVAGRCLAGCLAGYEGIDCSSECTDSYGVNCSSQCGSRQCAGDPDCNHITGSCIDGCKPGYQNDDCTQECNNGSYGSSCSAQCSDRHCNGSEKCNHISGTCIGGCKPGYQNDDCAQKCLPGSYGFKCFAQCSDRHCKGSDKCNHINGTCIEGCEPGYHKEDCTQNCNKGGYGSSCSAKCSDRHCNGSRDCNHINGTCIDGCKPGYQKEDCTQKCLKGMYGTKCFAKCSARHCNGSEECNHIKGSCIEGCKPGYQNDDCTQNCADGYYGKNCTAKCSERFCEEMSSPSCHHVTGICEGKCKENYSGTDCTQKLTGGKEGEPDNTIAIAVSVSVVVCLVAAGAAFFILRRRRSPKFKEDKTAKEMEMMNGNNNPKMAIVKPHKKSSTEENVYENAEIFADVVRNRHTEEPRQLENISVEVDVTDKENVNTDNAYYNLPSAKTTFTLEELESFITEAIEDNSFKSVFNSLSSEFSESYSVSQIPENRKKNRFQGYYPYDRTKVVLQQLPGDPHSDYINANYLDGHTGKRKYIAAQGPIVSSRDDFVRMIWEQKCVIVIMLTRTYEMGKMKCLQYWPEDEMVSYGDISLTLVEERHRANYTIRVVEMKKDKVKHRFHQFHYTRWPDHGVPDVHDLLDFLFSVNKVNPKSTAPQLVHCSAGVGRTGTYIAIDTALKSGSESINIIGTVSKMRQKRKGMIQTAPQLQFVYEALLEGLKRGDTSLSCDVMEKRSGIDNQFVIGNTSLSEQFNYLNTVPTTENKDTILLENEVALFRFPSYTIHDGYIFECLKNIDSNIIWKTAVEKQFPIVLIINNDTDKKGLYPAVETNKVYNDVTVYNKSEIRSTPQLNMSTFNVFQEGPETEVKMYILQMKKKDEPHVHLLELINLLSLKVGHSEPLLVFSSNLQYIQFFCILRNTIQRIKLDNEIEIFKTVHHVHSEIGQTANFLGEYTKLHRSALEYIQQDNTYANL